MNDLSTNRNTQNQTSWKIGEVKKTPVWVNFGFFLAAGWFTGIFLLYWIYQFTDITFTETLKWFAFFGVILTLIPYKWILKIITIEYTHLIALNLIAMGPILTALFLVLNMLFTSQTTTNTFAINSSGKSSIPFENHFVVVELANDALINQPRFRRFDEAYFSDIRDHDSIKFTISKGLFGYDVLDSYELVGKRER